MFNSGDLSRIRELMRRVENLLRYATVLDVDTSKARLKVQYADGTTSGWLPAFSQRAGDSISWHFPDIGERVMILSPSGEPTAGIALCGIYTDSHPNPSQDHDLHLMQYPNGDFHQHHRGSGDTQTHISGMHHIQYADGSFVQHDTSGNTVIKATGNITIMADGDMVLKAAKIYEN